MFRLLVVFGLFSVLQCDLFSALCKLQDLLREEEKLQLSLNRYITSIQDSGQDVPPEISRYVWVGFFSNYYSPVKVLMIFMGVNIIFIGFEEFNFF